MPDPMSQVDARALERAASARALAAQREHVLDSLDELPEKALRRPVLPSGRSCLGLVRHLAVDVERVWFASVIAGEDVDVAEFGRGLAVWAVGADVPAAGVLDLHRREVARAEAVVAARDLGSAPANWPVDLFGSFRLGSVREVLLHVVTETACHAGHLDTARELLDGRQWLVLSA